MLHKAITSQHITSFISYMWIASLSQEHGISDTAHGILYAHMHLYSLTVRVYNVSFSHGCWVDPEISGKHQGIKKKLYWQEIYYSEKIQTERNRKRGGRKMSPLAVELSQYVATIAAPDKRRRWQWAPLRLKLICRCNPGCPQILSQFAWWWSAVNSQIIAANKQIKASC